MHPRSHLGMKTLPRENAAAVRRDAHLAAHTDKPRQEETSKDKNCVSDSYMFSYQNSLVWILSLKRIINCEART